MAPPDETDEHGASETNLCSAVKDMEMDDTEKASSSGRDGAALGTDRGVEVSTATNKRKDWRAPAEENGGRATKMFRSDAAKQRAEAEPGTTQAAEGDGEGAQHALNGSGTTGNGSDTTGKGGLDAACCEDVKSELHNNTGAFKMDACDSEAKDSLGANGTVHDSGRETAASCRNDVESSTVVVMEVAEESGFDGQADTKERAARSETGDVKCYFGINEDGMSCLVRGGSNVEQMMSRCESEITVKMNINGSESIKKGSAGGTGKSNQAGEVECGDQADMGLHTERVEAHDRAEKKVEEPCHADAKTVAEGTNIDNSKCTEKNEAMQIDTTERKKCENDTELECGSRPLVLERREETGALEKVSKVAAAPDRVFTRRKVRSNATKSAKCEEEVQFQKRVTRSVAAKHREDVGSISISTANEANSDRRERKDSVLPRHKRKADYHLFSKSNCTGMVQSGMDTDKQIFETKLADQGDADPAEMTTNVDVDTLKLKAFHRSRSSSSVRKRTEEYASAMDKNICSPAITERDDKELTDSEGAKFENSTASPKAGLSVGAKIVAIKKRIMESELDDRIGGSAAAAPCRKKTKIESSGTEVELPDKSARKKLTGKNCGLGKKSIQKKQQGSSPMVDRTRSATRRSQKPDRLSENESDDLDAEVDKNTSRRRILRGRSRDGGSAVVLEKQKKSSRSEMVTITRKDRLGSKGSGNKCGVGTTSKYSPVASRTRHFGTSPSTKYESKSLSKKPGRSEVNSPNGKNMVEAACSLKPSVPSKQGSAGGRAEQKRKISEQIKGILLDAGWKIDLRPRNGRDYLDSVYIHPSGIGSYWSVTKAYAAFVSDMECEHNDTGKRSPSKPSKGIPSEGKSSTFCSLPAELLSKLKRTVVNKRTSKIVLQKSKKKKRGNVGKAKEKNNRSSSSKRLHSGKERKKRGGCTLLVRGSNKKAGNSSDCFVPYEWKRSVFSWLIDLDILSVNTKVKYMDESRTQVLLEGLVKRDGINCSCCSKVLPVFEFETHAGGEGCKPYRNILVDGLEIDLLHCLINAWDKQSDSERRAFFPINTDGDDPNDDTCGICGDGGDLICCDGCPSTFHMSCLGIEELPSDDWRCANCSCKFCQEHSTPDVPDIGEVDSSLLVCARCEEKYHQLCAPEIDSISCISSQLGNLFCQQSCRQLSRGLQNFLAVKNDLEHGFSCRMIQRVDEDLPETDLGLDQKVECNSKLAVALAIMDECFLPIVDQRTGINLIHNVVYNCGSNFVRLDFHGFYTFILERGDEIISAASIRLHGTKLAEMPFIGTRHMYRRQGMCRRLLDGIESILCSLNVEKLIIPAIDELVDTWTNRFGFRPLEVSHKQEVKSISMLVFPGTGLLQKPLLSKASTRKSTISQEDTVSAEGKSKGTPGEAKEASPYSDADVELHDSKRQNLEDNDRYARHCNGDTPQESIDAAPCVSKAETSEERSSSTTASEEFVLQSVGACKEDALVSSRSQESPELDSNLGSMGSTKVIEIKHVADGDERESLAIEVTANETPKECASVDIVADTKESGPEDATICHQDGSASPRQHDETQPTS